MRASHRSANSTHSFDPVSAQHACEILNNEGIACSPATFRVWSRFGLVPIAFTLPNGWRVYDRAALVRFARSRRHELDTQRAIAAREPGGVG
jgi:hypothetical protein